MYRRPGRTSEITGKFYFFGAGKISEIQPLGDNRVKGIITNPVAFHQNLYPEDLEEFPWSFKQKGPNWANFFNQYGMNQITKADFTGLLKLGLQGPEDLMTDENLQTMIELTQKMNSNDFSVDDYTSTQKVRIGHQAFANRVKLNYQLTCGITGITSRAFLIASHIVPWSERQDTRLDPQNGICLSTLVDKAFEEGYISFSDDLSVILSTQLNSDPVLFKLLKPYEGKKLRVNPSVQPKLEYIRWHRENKFR